MDFKESKVEIPRTGVYYQAGNLSASRQWFCCHGYGQLADRMIQKFDRRVEKGERVVCVEALNRFYWKGVGGSPVATWMTSRYRLDEIRDNSNYLSKVYKTEIASSKENILFGFSQGGTTMWRWIHEKRPDYDVFINYAGWIPEDIDLTVLQDYMRGKKLIYVYGSKDEYVTEDRIVAIKQVIEKSGLDIEIVNFDGNHSIDRDLVDKLIK